MMYKQPVLNQFYVELFSTNYNDYETPTQNAKTDNICMNPNIEFDEWLDDLIETFCRDNNFTFEDIKEAIKDEPKFEEDMREEFDYLKEEMQELLDEEDEDFDEDEED